MSSSSPLVSVITATYNWSSVLRYAIQTALWQTVQDFEMLVIGDGCTDDSGEVVASFREPRLRWHNLPQNSGSQSTPNNTGLEMAQGKYVAYLGHDDVWRPTHLQALSQALEETSADIGYTIAENIGPPESGIRLLTGISPSGGYERGLVIPPSSMMHKREVAQEIGGWKDYRTLHVAPDTEFLMRAYDHGKKIVPVNELSVLKFNSAWRKNSYREKPSHEQAEYVWRIQSEPDFICRELLAIVRTLVIKHPETILRAPTPPEGAPLGWFVEQMRAYRGLPPNELRPTALPVIPIRRRIRRAVKYRLRRVLRRALKRLEE